MRIFGDGFLKGPEGRYPSLKVCDEIDPNTIIQAESKEGKVTKTIWSTIHDQFNLGWKRSYDKWNSNKTDFSEKYKAMQLKMNAFWDELGQKFCKENGYVKIKKADEIDGTLQMYEDTLCIVNFDNSGSMSPSSSEPNSKFNLAVKGAK